MGGANDELTLFGVYPFLCRLVHSGSARSSPAQGADLVFATRTGTGRGIESHVFRVETHWDLSSWTRALVQGGHSAAELIKEISIGEWMCMSVSVEAAEGRTAHNDGWNRANGMASNTWKP